MKRLSTCAAALLCGSLVLALSAPNALAQGRGGSAGKGQGQTLRLRDGSCGTTPIMQRDQTQTQNATRDQLRMQTQDQLRTYDRQRSQTRTR
ncbi:MAG: hypothetical protein ACM3ON_02250 [Chloroflexota bacterium]